MPYSIKSENKSIILFLHLHTCKYQYGKTAYLQSYITSVLAKVN